MLWFVLPSLFLLQVVTKEELREETILHNRRCRWFGCCFFCVSAQSIFDRSFLGNDAIEALVLNIEAFQPADAFAVRP